MKTKVTILASLFALMFSPVHAAEGPEKKSDEESEVEVIQVYGKLRQSFEGSVGMKRLADTVVDGITAEDIGQFSDDSIASAIQRIPGVQIETDDAGTDGDRVSIRGLGPEFVNSTINGRRLLSSGNEAKSLRKMNFNAFPPSILGGVQVIKGQTADRPESGLAGQVDLLTLKPLEIKKLAEKTSFGQVTVRGTQQDITDGSGWRLNAIGGWRNDDNTFGGYLGAVISEVETARDQVRLNYKTSKLNLDTTGDGKADSTLDDVSIANAVTMNPIREQPKRTAFATGLQYQPTEDIDIVWDLMYSNYNNESTRDQNQISMSKAWKKAVFDNSIADDPALIVDENNVVRYADFGRTSKAGVIKDNVSSMIFDNETENLITGLNVNLNSGNWTSNFDVYYSSVDYQQDLRYARATKNLDQGQFIFDATGELPQLTAPDANDVVGYNFFRSTVREIELEGDNYGLTYKGSYFIEDSVVSSLDFGMHYDETNLDSKRSNIQHFTNSGDTGVAILDAALTGETIDQDFLASESFMPARWLQMDFDTVAEMDPRALTTGFDELGVDPTSSYESTESIFSLWAQANIDLEIGDLPLTGNIGVRAVNTDHEATAGEITNDGEAVPITTGNDYWELLPSINLNLALMEELALRLSFSQTLSRPDYAQLAPINSINIVDDGVNKATKGNPDLQPMMSNNYDITFEYYSDSDGAYVLSGFYKDVSNFIVETTMTDVTLPGEEGLFEVTTPINFSDGKAQGIEIGIYQPLDKLIPAIAGFGFSTNYTYVDTEFDEDVGDAGFGFPGASKNNFNFIGFYDADLFSVRVAYVYRSEFFRSLAGAGSQTDTARFTAAQEKLDLSVSLRPMKSLSLMFNVSNLTDETRRDYVGDEGTFLDFFDRGRTYSVAATYKF